MEVNSQEKEREREKEIRNEIAYTWHIKSQVGTSKFSPLLYTKKIAKIQKIKIARLMCLNGTILYQNFVSNSSILYTICIWKHAVFEFPLYWGINGRAMNEEIKSQRSASGKVVSSNVIVNQNTHTHIQNVFGIHKCYLSRRSTNGFSSFQFTSCIACIHHSRWVSLLFALRIGTKTQRNCSNRTWWWEESVCETTTTLRKSWWQI